MDVGNAETQISADYTDYTDEGVDNAETQISADYTDYTDEGLIMQETQISADDGVDNSRNTD